jgi:tetratricopeptide (TPR) repeat protein
MNAKMMMPYSRQIGAGRASLAMSRIFLIFGLLVLTACSSVPKSDALQNAPATVSMEEWMSRGTAAAQSGYSAKAREAWRSAAQNYPAARQPWLKISEDYFNTGDYGNAVIAAQEALQREPYDRFANSIIAVSGLRLAASSLRVLRDENNYAVGSREEAINLTRTLRDALGESALIPQGELQKRVKRPMRMGQAGTEPVAVHPAVKPVAQPNVSDIQSSKNPLDKLR